MAETLEDPGMPIKIGGTPIVKLESLSRKGATILVNPVKGFDEHRIAFVDLNTKNTKCGLVELLEIK